MSNPCHGGNTANNNSPRVVMEARFDVPRKDRARRVCVRAVDGFGFEVEVVQNVAEGGAR